MALNTETILHLAPFPCYWKDTDGRYVGCNPRYARLLGIDTPESATGKSDRELLANPTQAEAIRAEDAAVLEGSEFFERPITWSVEQGRDRQLSVTKIRIRDGSRKTIGMMCVMLDLSNQANIDEHLATGARLEAIGQLASGIAHEINTPIQYVSDNTLFLEEVSGQCVELLASAIALAKSAADGHDAQSQAQQFLAQVEQADFEFIAEEMPLAISHALRGIERIRDIVRSMKQFSHPGDGELQDRDLNAALRNTAVVATNEWKYVATVDYELDEALPLVQCHIGELNQVFLNLIVNAAHAISEARENDTQHEGKIEIRSRALGEQAEITIADNGCGMPDAVRQRIFEPFFTTKQVGKGTGQGLAIAYQIVTTRHSGSIEVTSEPGVGTTFRLLIPIKAPPKPLDTTHSHAA